MAKKHQPKRDIDKLTDFEIYEAIRDLEPDSTTNNSTRTHSADNEKQDSTPFTVVWIIMLILLIGSIVFMCFYLTELSG